MKTVSLSDLNNLKRSGAEVRRLGDVDLIAQLRLALSRVEDSANQEDVTHAMEQIDTLFGLVSELKQSLSQSMESVTHTVQQSIAEVSGQLTAKNESMLEMLREIESRKPEEIHHHPVIERVEQPVHTVEKWLKGPSRQAFDLTYSNGRVIGMQSEKNQCTVEYDRFSNPSRLIMQRKGE